MPRFILIATCQIQSLALLTQNMVPEASVLGIDYTDHTAYRPEALALFEEELQKADFILAQMGGFGPYASTELKKRFPEKMHTLATIYFRGLHPDSCYVGAEGDHFQDPSLYHSLAVLEAFLRGQSEQQTAREAFTYDTFERLGLFSAWDDSLEEIRRIDSVVDFPIAGLIENFCLEQPGFLSFNHPSLALLHVYLSGVFKWLGLPQRAMDLATAKDPLAAHDIVPIHDFVAERFHLPYRTTQHWLVAHLSLFIDRADFVRRSFELYRRVDPKKLTVASPNDLKAFLSKSDALRFLLPPESAPS